MIDSAEEWLVFASQFVPNGRVADRLVAAHRRGVDVQLAYNDPTYWGAVGGIMQRRVLAKQQRRAPELFAAGKLSEASRPLHAKVLASERGAMVGSHNLSEAGIKFGTSEIALFRDSPAFAHATRLLLMQQVEFAETL